MTRNVLIIAIFLTFCGQSVAQEDNTRKIDSLSWIAGHWISEKNGNIVEEVWIPPQGGLMLGMNRAVSKAGTAGFDFMRIAETGSGLVYFASPNSVEPTPFELIELAEFKAVFENLKHDFPQRITYHRQGDTLVARVESTIEGNTQAIEWQFTKAVSSVIARKAPEWNSKTFDAAVLIGVWKYTTGYKAGKKSLPEMMQGEVTVNEKTFTIPGGADQTFVMAYKIDATKTPVVIDMEVEAGPSEGTAFGIIKVEKEQMVLCYHFSKRPSEFKSTAENGYHLFTLKKRPPLE